MVCNQCKIDKSEDCFQLRNDTGKYRSVCKECRRENNRIYYREKGYKKDRHEYYLKRKELGKIKKYKELPIESKKKRNEKQKNKKETDLVFRVVSNLRSSLSSRLGRVKTSSTFSFIGCSSGEEVIKHLISTANITEDFFFSNRFNFHIDHIIPLSLYDLKDDEEMKKAWNIKNLRLISKEENLLKGNMFDNELVLRYDIRNLLPRGIDENNTKN